MEIRMKTLIAAALVVTVVPMVAAVGQEAGVTVNAPKQVCRRMEVPASGSRIARRRVCMTAAQWRARSDVSTDDAEDVLDVLGRADPAHTAPNGFKAPAPR
jgi:hypothetical protein